jgi:membrane protease YdiL (CAAX protease family)
MNSFRPHQRLILFLFFVLALTSLLSPWFALSASWISDHWPSLLPERYSFAKIFNRTFMISGILLFFLFRRMLGINRAADLGLTRLRDGCGDLTVGWLLAVGSVVWLAAVMTLFDVFTPFFRLALAESIRRCASALTAGMFAGLLEEVFFRGILFKGLFEQGQMRAYLGANLFYSALHFVKPDETNSMNAFDPLAGFRYLASTFTPFLEPLPLLPGIFGLFLIGVVLSFAFYRTANLYLAIGLHAGWVFGLKTLRVFGDFRREDLGWMFGSAEPKLLSGAITWVGIVLVAVAVYWLTRHRPHLHTAAPSLQFKVTATAFNDRYPR